MSWRKGVADFLKSGFFKSGVLKSGFFRPSFLKSVSVRGNCIGQLGHRVGLFWGSGRRRRSLFWRLSALACIWAVGLLGAGAVGLTTLYRSAVLRDLHDSLDATLATLAVGLDLDGKGDVRVTVQLPDPRFLETFSGRYWSVASADRPLLPLDQSRSLWDEILPVDIGAISAAIADPSSISSYSRPGPDGQILQVRLRLVRIGPQGTPLLIFAAADRTSLDRDVRLFRNAVLWTLAALAVALLVAVLGLVRLGLRPLYHFGVAVGEIRCGARRVLDRDAPAELLPLADELNALITHNHAIVEHAQARAGDLAHALKTPIAVLVAEADGEGSALAQQVRRQAQVMGGHVDRHLKGAGAAARAKDINVRTPLGGLLDDLVRTVPKLHPGKSIDITVDIAGDPGGLVVRAGREDVAEVIGNVLDNAVKWARSQVVVRAHVTRPRWLDVEISDDGPGLAADQRDAVMQRGTRLDETQPGSGLGLAIVRDLVDAMGGQLALDRGEAGGLRVIVQLPHANTNGAIPI